jgi:hypothetical protein
MALQPQLTAAVTNVPASGVNRTVGFEQKGVG